MVGLGKRGLGKKELGKKGLGKKGYRGLAVSGIALAVMGVAGLCGGVAFWHRVPVRYGIARHPWENAEDTVIARAKDGCTGRFPDIVEAGGRLIAAYYWNDSHAPYVLGEIRINYGESDGSGWGLEPAVFIGEAFLAEYGLGLWKGDGGYYDSPDEARDPNFAVLGDKILFTFFTRLPWDCGSGGKCYVQYSETSDYTYGRTYLMYSEDKGETWAPPVEVECRYLDGGCAKRGNIAVLGEDKILIPLYGFHHGGGGDFTTANVVAVWKEGGWEFEEEYCTHQEGGVSVGGAFETGVTEVSFTTLGGYVYALCRPNGDILMSGDLGKTWEKLDVSGNGGMVLHQPSLGVIPESSQILASWSEPNAAGGRDIYLYLFQPGKDRVWEYQEKSCIYHNENAGDMGDPTSILLPDKQVLTVYYDGQKGVVGCTKTALTSTALRK